MQNLTSRLMKNKIRSHPVSRACGVWIASILLLLVACGKSAPASPLPPLPILPTQTNVPLSPAPAAAATQASLPRYSLAIHNQYEWEAYVFLDGAYLFKIAPGRSGSYMDLPAGLHSLKFCNDQKATLCESPLSFEATGDTVLVSGQGLAAVNPETTSPLVLPTGAFQPTIIVQTPIPSTTPPQAAPTRIIIPTLRPSQMWFMVTIHNRYPWSLAVFLDRHFLMTVPAHKYMWHLGIQGGERQFNFCDGVNTCITREIYLDHDLEIIVSP